jgi:hypothetical protein
VEVVPEQVGLNVPEQVGLNGPARVVPSDRAQVVPNGPARVVPSDRAQVVPNGPARVVPSDRAQVVPNGPARDVPSGPARDVPSGLQFVQNGQAMHARSDLRLVRRNRERGIAKRTGRASKHAHSNVHVRNSKHASSVHVRNSKHASSVHVRNSKQGRGRRLDRRVVMVRINGPARRERDLEPGGIKSNAMRRAFLLVRAPGGGRLRRHRGIGGGHAAPAQRLRVVMEFSC